MSEPKTALTPAAAPAVTPKPADASAKAQVASPATGTVAGTASSFPGVNGSTAAPGIVEEVAMANDLGTMVVTHR